MTATDSPLPVGQADQSPADLRSPRRYEGEDIIDISHLVRVWLRWSWIPILFAIVGSYYGYRDLTSFEPEAVATMVVLPAAALSSGQSTTSSGGGLGTIAAQFGIQLGTPTGATPPFDRLKLLLSSQELAGELHKRYGLLQKIYAGSWNAEQGVWQRPSSADFERDQRIRKVLRLNAWMPPDLEALAGYIQGSINIEPVTAGVGFQRVSVSHRDPEFALWLLETAFFEADNLLREKDRQQSVERQEQIQRQMQQYSMLQIQDALRSLLINELSRAISLQSSLPYTASVVVAPYVSSRRTEPNLAFMFAVPMAGWAVAGFLLVTLIAVFRHERRSS